MRAAVLMLLFTTFALPVAAQTASQDVTIPPPPLKTVSLSGPRFGVTALSDGVVQKLQERSIEVGSNISQFGWQFEKEFYSKQGGVAALHELVFLVGGLEQGVALPSVNWLVGLERQTAPSSGSVRTSLQ